MSKKSWLDFIVTYYIKDLLDRDGSVISVYIGLEG